MGMISHTIPWQIFQRREISPVSVVCDVGTSQYVYRCWYKYLSITFNMQNPTTLEMAPIEHHTEQLPLCSVRLGYCLTVD